VNCGIRALTIVALVLLLASCTIEIPRFSSGDAVLYEEGSPIREWNLSSAQLNHLNKWLAEHRSGWRPTPVNYAPSLLLMLHGSDHDASVNVAPTYVVVTDSSLSLSYEQAFTEADLSTLRRALTEGA
jgi:hypothetical protein